MIAPPPLPYYIVSYGIDRRYAEHLATGADLPAICGCRINQRVGDVDAPDDERWTHVRPALSGSSASAR